jgi:GGDEF domain-containing protein
MPARPLTILTADAQVASVCRDAARRAGEAIGKVEEFSELRKLEAAGTRSGIVIADPRALAPWSIQEWALGYLQRNHVLLFLLSEQGDLRNADGLARFVGAQAALPIPPDVKDLAERLRSPFGAAGQAAPEPTPLASAEVLGAAVMQALQGQREPGARERFLAAIADEETSLHSMEYWQHRLEEEFKRCNRFRYPLGLAGFTLEGEVDDGTLLDVAGVILLDTRDVDVACRVGQNTFVALLPHTGPEGTSQFAERVKKRIESRKLTDLLGENLDVTIRTATCPDAAIGTPGDFLAKVLAPDSGVPA